MSHRKESFATTAAVRSSSTQSKLITLSFQERERQREIDKQNKMLLGQLLQIEKNCSKTKRKKSHLAIQPQIKTH